MIANLLKWLFFSVALSILPIASNAVSLKVNGRTVCAENIIGKGELLLIAGGLCAAALGKIIGSTSAKKHAKILSGGFCTVLLVFSSLLFAAFTEARLNNPNVDLEIIVNYSLLIFLGSVITSSCCAALSE